MPLTYWPILFLSPTGRGTNFRSKFIMFISQVGPHELELCTWVNVAGHGWLATTNPSIPSLDGKKRETELCLDCVKSLLGNHYHVTSI